MAESPNKNSGQQVRFTIYSDGEEIKDYLDIISIETDCAVNKIGKCVLTLNAGDMPRAEVPESDLDTFDTGKNIRVEVGYGDDEQCIFDGVIISHNLDLEEGNQGSLRIECREYTFLMTQSRRNKVFNSSTDSAAIGEVIGKYSLLTSEITGTEYEHPDLLQYYCTDWDFILSRAEANGLVVYTDGKTVKVKKPDVTSSPVLKVTYGTDVISFKGELLAENQWETVEALGWNPATQEIIKVTGNPPSLNDQGEITTAKLAEATGSDTQVLQTGLCADQATLQAWADGQLLKSGLGRIQGEICFHGNATVKTGNLISLDGFGKRFNGDSYIGRVEHKIQDGEWTTTAGMGLPTESISEMPNVVAPVASGLLPGIQGLQIGKVVKLHQDPGKENRIQVKVPVLGNEANTVWARLGSPWASKRYGSFFIPDINDEVILGFFNNDPCSPVILGSLYSSNYIPPYELTKDNFIRGIVTKEGMKQIFDEENKVITIETPGGNKIVISDKDKGITLTDQKGNIIKTNDSGITIESKGDLVLKAQNNITMESGMATNIKAKTDLKSEGLNVETKAKTTLKMQGTASAEFSASGQTIVKGAMVMIN